METLLNVGFSFFFELYRDYATFTIKRRDEVKESFPNRQVVDDVLIQLATCIRNTALEANFEGFIVLSVKWQHTSFYQYIEN